MKKKINVLIVLLFIAGGFVLSSCHHHQEAKTETEGMEYTCPMHPSILKISPGNCPICGMDLVPVKKDTKTKLVLSDQQLELAGIKTRKIRTANFTASTMLNARVKANPELTEVISAKFPGRIEKLFVREAGIQVEKGQPLYQVYSEELQALQQDFLLQVKQQRAFPSEKIYQTLKEAAKNKLQLFGFSKAQIAALEKRSSVDPRVTVYASAAGTVEELGVAEGQYISEGTAIFKIQDLSVLWVEADVYPAEAASLDRGKTVMVAIEGQVEQRACIDFISPALEPGSQILKIRITIPNTGSIMPGMRALVSLPSATLNKGIALPLDAVIRDEDAAIVWVKRGKNTFEPRKVTTANEDENNIIITSGLEGVTEVVVEGAYLLNSEHLLSPQNAQN